MQRRSADPPLIAGTIHGVRAWAIAGPPGDERLDGAYQHSPWALGGKATEARCDVAGHAGVGPPGADCGCGLYCLHPHRAELSGELAAADPRDGRCYGVIEAWGRVEVHADGFRAQYARPVALVLETAARRSLAEPRLRRLAERHGAEVVVAEGAEDLERICAERGWGLDPAAVDSLLGGYEGRRPPDGPTGPARRPPRGLRGRLRAVGSFAGTAALVLLAIAWYGGLALVGVALLIGFLAGGSDGPAEAPLPRPRVETLDTRISALNGGVVYVTRVRNRSEGEAAVDVRLEGRLVNAAGETVAGLNRRRTDQLRPTIPPAATGVVVGWVERTPGREARMDAGVATLALRGDLAEATSAVGGRGVPALSFVAPAFDPGSCVVTARARSARPFPAVRVQVLGFDGRRFVGLLWGQAGPLGPEPVRQALVRLSPRDCARGEDAPGRRLEVYPDLRRGELDPSGP